MSAINWIIDRWFSKNPRLRGTVTALLEGDAPREVEVLGAKLTVHPVKEHGYLRASRLSNRSTLFRDEVPVLLSLTAVLAGADAFVDIGANVGLYVITLAKLRHLYPLHFYAFEANPDTFTRLSASATPMGITCHGVGLADRPGTLTFVEGAVSNVFALEAHKTSFSLDRTTAVECRRLDSFAIEGRRIVLKIDVEGMELDVLNGASALFDADRIHAVYVDGYTNRGVDEFLQRRGFVFHDGRSLAPSRPPVYSLLALKRG